MSYAYIIYYGICIAIIYPFGLMNICPMSHCLKYIIMLLSYHKTLKFPWLYPIQYGKLLIEKFALMTFD